MLFCFLKFLHFFLNKLIVGLVYVFKCLLQAKVVTKKVQKATKPPVKQSSIDISTSSDDEVARKTVTLKKQEVAAKNGSVTKKGKESSSSSGSSDDDSSSSDDEVSCILHFVNFG